MDVLSNIEELKLLLAQISKEVKNIETKDEEIEKRFSSINDQIKTYEVRIAKMKKLLDGAYEKANNEIQKIFSADITIVRNALRELLTNKADQKMPLLDKIISEEAPQHKNTPLLKVAMSVRIPVWVYGDAGSGKTTAAFNVAKALNLPFRFISVCPITTKSEFLGYRDAAGTYQSTAFREIYENGGVFLIDEIDNGNPSVLSVLNTALANDWCAFPDKNVKRHDDTIFIAAANTIGKGADIRYVGRCRIDAATLDRFVFVPMDIDEKLEEALITGNWNKSDVVDITKGKKIDVKKWLKFVQKVRFTCNDLGIDHLITPRASIYGKLLIAAGLSQHYIEEMCVWKGIRDTDKIKIKNNLQ